jgi:biopolymer transport protein ExbD
VTPLLDLVFILLFAFMVALPLISGSDSLFPPSPSIAAETRAKTDPAEMATLSLAPNGDVVWQGEPTRWTDVPGLIEAAVAQQPQLGVVVEVPPDQTVANLAKMMNLLVTAGVQRTAIEVKAPQP